MFPPDVNVVKVSDDGPYAYRHPKTPWLGNVPAWLSFSEEVESPTTSRWPWEVLCHPTEQLTVTIHGPELLFVKMCQVSLPWPGFWVEESAKFGLRSYGKVGLSEWPMFWEQWTEAVKEDRRDRKRLRTIWLKVTLE